MRANSLFKILFTSATVRCLVCSQISRRQLRIEARGPSHEAGGGGDSGVSTPEAVGVIVTLELSLSVSHFLAAHNRV